MQTAIIATLAVLAGLIIGALGGFFGKRLTNSKRVSEARSEASGILEEAKEQKRAVLLEAKEEGIEQRYKRYTACWNTLVKGLDQLGLKYAVDPRYHSKLITSVYEPENLKFSFEDLHEYCSKRRFTLYPGKMPRVDTFRIANIGDIDETDIKAFLEVFKGYLNSIV